MAVGFVALMACAPPPAAPSAGVAPLANSATPAAQAPVAPREPRTLQMGIVSVSGFFYPMWTAVQKGQFREAGLDVEWNTVSTNESISALVGGSIDVLQASTDGALTALSKGAPIRLVADFMLEAPYDLVARPDVASVAELRGRKIGASSLRASSGTIVRVMMQRRGLRDEDYELVQAGGNPQRYAALQTGGIDAAILTDPANFRAELDGYRTVMAFSEVAPEYSFSSWWVRGDWLDSAPNREALVSFLTALTRAKAWAHAPENREALIALWMEETRSPRDIVERMYDYYVIKRPNLIDFGDVRAGPIQTVVQIMGELEDLPALPPEAQWIDRGAAQEARQRAATLP